MRVKFRLISQLVLWIEIFLYDQWFLPLLNNGENRVSRG